MTGDDKSKEVLKALSALAKTSELSVNELRIVLALERLVARLEFHEVLCEKLIFKGGFALFKELESRRFTRDLDALADGISKESVEVYVIEALSIDLNDGLSYAEPVFGDLIDQGHYGGIMIKIPFQIGPLPTEERKLRKLSRIHLDVGFGDVIRGGGDLAQMRSIFAGEKPVSWKVYPIETIFAEKLETLVSRGSANSRAKDMFDLVGIFDTVKANRALLPSIQETFDNRSTALPASFLEFFKDLDLTVLMRSWGTVELQGMGLRFEECRKQLEDILLQIDELLG